MSIAATQRKRVAAETTRPAPFAHQHQSQTARPRCSSRTPQIAGVSSAQANPLTAAAANPKKRQQRPHRHTGQTAVVLLRSEPDHVADTPLTGGYEIALS